jgi:GNAT superfamily N-acetyltransferase
MVASEPLRIPNGMLITGNPPHVQDIPFGIERPLRQLVKEAGSQPHLVHRNGQNLAQIDGRQINLSVDPWIRRHRETQAGLRFQLATDDSHLIEARELLERSHPKRSPNTGLYLICSFVDLEEQEAHFRDKKRTSGRHDLWSPVWHAAPSYVVGCLVISRLFHGNPRGRRGIIEDSGIQIPEDPPPTRDVIVKSLSVAWVSRIAVDAPYRDMGIGTALLKEARRIAQDRFPWPTKYLEVIRTKQRLQK